MVGLYRSVVAWLDRDWERRRYNPTFAFAQKLFWLSPFFLISAICLIAGAKPGDFLYDKVLLIGLALSIIPFSISTYRWLRGYSRPSWHEEQARKRRERSG